MRCYFQAKEDIQVISADCDTFASHAQLASFVAGCDVVIHLAGMNRGDDGEIFATNVELTRNLIEACEETGSKPHILFASSIHFRRKTAYGRSKKLCSSMFNDWAERSGAKFTNLILPNMFGEHGQPFYNSMVATFSFQLAQGDEPKIIEDSLVELMHAQDLAEEISAIIEHSVDGDIRLVGRKLRVNGVLGKLREFDALYRRNIVPDLSDPFDRNLFNTYRSYFFPQAYPFQAELRRDDRGELFEAVKAEQGGQCFISTTKPGVTRGNHYHRHKFERFLVIKGEGIIRIRKLFSDVVNEFHVLGNNPEYVDIPTLHTHNLTNVGEDDLITLFWAHEHFDPMSPDTIPERV